MTAPLRVLLVGHGRMGRLVESLCGEHGLAIAGVVDRASSGNPASWPDADVAIDFGPLAARTMRVVIGTTGWSPHEPALRALADRHGVGVVAAPNFALGVALFSAIVERAGEVLAQQPSFGAWIHELHHAAKRDAPSGTALALERVLRDAGYPGSVNVASTRAGAIPGTHTVGFDSAGETITLTHAVRDRTPFARGALEAARWIAGRTGWYTMRDVLGL